jgi:hypothetical protein
MTRLCSPRALFKLISAPLPPLQAEDRGALEATTIPTHQGPSNQGVGSHGELPGVTEQAEGRS